MLSVKTGMSPNPLGFRYLEGQVINWAKESWKIAALCKMNICYKLAITPKGM